MGNSKFFLVFRNWCQGAESNRGHPDFQSGALPLSYPGAEVMAGPTGFEPATSGLTGRRADQATPRAHRAVTSLKQKNSVVNSALSLNFSPPLIKDDSSDY